MFLSRGDRDLGVAFQTHPGRQAFISSGSKEPRSALESPRVGNPFQTKQGSRPSCPDQEGRKGSEEWVPENLNVPLVNRELPDVQADFRKGRGTRDQIANILWIMVKAREEKAMAPHSSTLAWRIPWMEKPGGLQSMGSLRVRHG